MTQNEFLTGTEQYNEDIKQFWNEIQNKEYYDFKEGVSTICEFSEWKTDNNAPPDKYGRTHVLKAKIKVDKEEFYFSTRSTRLLNALKPFFIDKNPVKDIVTVKVKQIGKDNSVQYDVEAVQ